MTYDDDGDFDSAVLLSRNSWMIPMLALAAVNVCIILILEIGAGTDSTL